MPSTTKPGITATPGFIKDDGPHPHPPPPSRSDRRQRWTRNVGCRLNWTGSDPLHRLMPRRPFSGGTSTARTKSFERPRGFPVESASVAGVKIAGPPGLGIALRDAGKRGRSNRRFVRRRRFVRHSGPIRRTNRRDRHDPHARLTRHLRNRHLRDLGECCQLKHWQANRNRRGQHRPPVHAHFRSPFFENGPPHGVARPVPTGARNGTTKTHSLIRYESADSL